MSFGGNHVLALESRRAKEMAQLIRNQQGEPFVAPSMREIPLERNEEAFDFAEKLFAGGFDMVVLLTGVGTRLLDQVLSTRYAAGRFAEALRGVTVVARGPKPVAVLREMRVPATIVAPEPNTWREVLAATQGRPERNVAVQEYGKSNLELLDGFRVRGAAVSTVRVYQWDLPEDLDPLREAARRLAAGEFEAVLFTTSIQPDHLFRVAARAGIEAQVRDGLSRMMIASIGPTTTEALEDHGIHVDLEPSHPKMGLLVQEAADRFEALARGKR
jgi:uroporphyrinogen-III synthase